MSQEGVVAMAVSEQVSRHYSREGLEEAILAALRVNGGDQDVVTVEALAPVDEFHIGGREATVELASALRPRPDDHVLDVGSGLGGTARYLAATYGCRVSGVDLTPDYVQTATALTARAGLADSVRFQQADALDLPFDDTSFDAVSMLHVAMNIEDKQALCRELRRVVRCGATCAVYDVMRTGDGDLEYPVPWANTKDTSFLVDAGAYQDCLVAAGFDVVSVADYRDFALTFFRRMQQAASAGPPPLGLHLLMGDNAAAKVANMIRNVDRGIIAPTLIVATAS